MKKNHPKINRCFYCDKEATNITIDDADEMLYLCDKHCKTYRSKYPKEGYKSKQEGDF
jgi:hypothetical protein